MVKHTRSNHRNLEDLELEHALDVEVHVLPLAEVIPQPVACPLARRREGAPRDQEGTLVRVKGLQREMRRLFFHHAPEVVHVEFSVPTGVRSVRCDVAVRQWTVA